MRAASVALIGTLAAAGVASAEPKPNPADAPAGRYALDARHTSVLASVTHMGLSHFTMRIKGVQGTYDYDPAHPEASRISVTLDARTLDAGDPAVSQEFAKEFLAADIRPEITFVSTSIVPGAGGHGVVRGDLTFRGVTRPVELQVAYNGFDSSMILGKHMGFSATGTIRRSEFGSKAYLGQVSDEVKLVIETEFAKK